MFTKSTSINSRMQTSQSSLPSINKSCPVMTPMSLPELMELYILQKDYHEHPDQIANDGFAYKQIFQKHYENLLKKHNVHPYISSCIVPAMFKSQLNVPCIIFNTNAGLRGQLGAKQPLIIHTHGGPHVCITPDLYHAEIAYFLSKGFAVACPNYRGSSGYSPTCPPPEEWVKIQKNFVNIEYEITGPEDVYAVAEYMRQKPYIDPNKIFLRGGSFGSFINSQLLKQIQQGKFKNIFAGVHLSGGINYPEAYSLPVDIPILITHGLQDPIASCNEAINFINDILIVRQFFLTKDLSCCQQVATFIATNGNHHLIDPTLNINDLNFHFKVKKILNQLGGDQKNKLIKPIGHCSPAEELELYLSLSTGFIIGLLNDTYKFPPLHEQILALPSYSDAPIDSLLAMQADEYVKEKFPVREPTNTIEHANTIRPGLCKIISIDLFNKHLHFGPTKALLKLYLKESYTGNISKDLSNFLKTVNFFEFPYKDSSSKKETYNGLLMATDQMFFSQIIEMIETEEGYLRENPKALVAYHAASGAILFLYTFINLWIIMLSGKDIPENLDTINKMRFYDFITNNFSKISNFLKEMRFRAKGRYGTETPKDKEYIIPELYYYYVSNTTEAKKEYFNILLENILIKVFCGSQVNFNSTELFKNSVLACNPSILSNNHSTASWSLWWYFKKTFNSITSENKIETFTVIKLFLRILGFESLATISNYYQLFNELLPELEQQAIMQQIFIPYDLANKLIYLSQIWGIPFDKEFGALPLTDVIQQLTLAPELLEETIRKLYREEFFNVEQNPNFGKPITEKGIYFVSLLQFRTLLSFNKSDGVDIKTYVRSQELFTNMVSRLSALIRKDFANYLANETLLSDAVMVGADKEKNNFLTKYLGDPSQKSLSISLNLLYELYKRLTTGLLRPCYIKYIANASKSQKADLQKMLPQKNKPSWITYKYDDEYNKRKNFSSIFELSSFIKGFTYYDLLIDAVDSSKFDLQEKQQLKKIIEFWSTNKSSFEVELNTSLSKLLKLCVHEYKYDLSKHEIINNDHCSKLTELESIVAREINRAAEYVLLEINRKTTYMHWQSHKCY